MKQFREARITPSPLYKRGAEDPVTSGRKGSRSSPLYKRGAQGGFSCSIDGRIYIGEVMHRRLFPVPYRFTYRVFSLLVNIDQLDALAARLRLLSHNRFNLFSIDDRDHGPRDGRPLRPWIDGVLAGFGVALDGGRVELLCFPRLLGYVFNPISIFYCRHADGGLRAVVCEVKNTFGEQHCYVLHENGAPLKWPVRGRRPKRFHVSPLISMDAEYDFRLSEPDTVLRIAIRVFQDHNLMLVATQSGRSQRLTDRALLRTGLRIPLMTFKVIAAIHWQALKIWLRGARLHHKPAPPQQEASG